MPRIPRPAGMEWTLNMGWLHHGEVIRIEGQGKFQVVKVNRCAATVREVDPKTVQFTDKLNGKRVQFKGAGRQFRISARSEVPVLRKKGE